MKHEPRQHIGRSLSVVLLLLALETTALPALDGKAPKGLAIGDRAIDFKLPGVDGRTYSLASFAKARLLAVVFTCNHCPTAQAYEERLVKLAKEYTPKGVAFVAISPNDPEAVRLDELGYTDLDDSFEAMKLRARERGFPFPYLYDGATQKTSRAYGPRATPHVFIFDSDRRLRYSGRVDDTESGRGIKSHDARNALDALLAGRPVPVERTRVFGCSIKWSEKRAAKKRFMRRLAAERVAVETAGAKDIAALRRNATKKLRLINVWSILCAPCVAELPDLVETNRMYRKRDFELITISIDPASQKEKVLAVLEKAQASNRNLIYDSSDRDALAEALDREWSGALPFTILVEPGGKIRYRREGEIELLELRRAIVEYLGRTYHARPHARK